MYDNLTGTHKKLLRRVADGKKTSVIAEEMGYSTHWVKQEVCKLLVVFGVPNRQALAAAAVRAGVIE